MIRNKQFYSGAVSLFMVIFSMLVITVVTLSFLRLMSADQRQSADNDLSQSAYDSALAGVEDAKRAILHYQKSCAADSSACAVLKSQLASTTCNTGLSSVVSIPAGASEVPIQRTGGSANDAKLDQAYTCVTIQPDTLEYEGSAAANEQKLIPLKSTSAFSSVKVSWFSKKDITDPSGEVSLTNLAAGAKLLEQSQWPVNRPSVLRTQLMQYGSSFRLADFDSENGAESNVNTVFLYPTSTSGGENRDIIALDNRKSGSDAYPSPALVGSNPTMTTCAPSVAAGGYSCSMTLTLPDPVGGGTRSAFLRLLPFYNATHFKVELMSATGLPVLFDGVQPKIDSTGRANDLFRRVEARVDIGTNDFPYPEAAVDVANTLCKDFTVTPSGYLKGSCAE